MLSWLKQKRIYSTIYFYDICKTLPLAVKIVFLLLVLDEEPLGVIGVVGVADGVGVEQGEVKEVVSAWPPWLIGDIQIWRQPPKPPPLPLLLSLLAAEAADKSVVEAAMIGDAAEEWVA